MSRKTKNVQQNPGMPTVAIFDLDGTIFDTEYAVSEITADLAKSAGLTTTANHVFQNVAGLGAKEKFQSIARAEGQTLNPDMLERLAADHECLKSELYNAPDLRVVDGVQDVIKNLSNQCVNIVAATNGYHDGAVKGLKNVGLLDYFEDRIYTPASVGGQKKPNPAIFLQILDDLKMPPGQAIGIEDSLAGVEGLARAGIKAYAYLDPRLGRGTISARRQAVAVFGNCTPVEAMRDIDTLITLGALKTRLGKNDFTP